MTITPDTLTTPALVGELLRLKGSAQAENLAALAAAANAAIPRYCKRDWFLASNAVNPVTEYLGGGNRQRLTLTHGPVQAPVLEGSTTAGSGAVSGLLSTAHLFTGQSAACTNFPARTAVLSVDSSTQVTLTQAATATGSVDVFFGPAVWLDNYGYGGTAPGAFAATSQLYEGVDWYLERDDPQQGGSRTGFVCRIGSVWDGRWVSRRGLLAAGIGKGQANVKVKYTAGYAGLPDDLQLAATKLVAAAWKAGVNEGWPPGRDALAGGRGGLANAVQDAIGGGTWPELSSIRSLLAPYRRLR